MSPVVLTRVVLGNEDHSEAHKERSTQWLLLRRDRTGGGNGEALGARYLFAFIVLSENNEFGRPFAVLLPIEEVERRTGDWRVQYQVSFKTKMALQADDHQQVVIFGSENDLPLA